MDVTAVRVAVEAVGRQDYGSATKLMRAATGTLANAPASVVSGLHRLVESEGMYSSFQFLRRTMFWGDPYGTLMTSLKDDLQPATHVRTKVPRYRALAQATSSEPDWTSLAQAAEEEGTAVRQSSGALPWLAPLQDLFVREATIVARLLRAHVAMSSYDLKEAAADLFESRTALRAWQADVALAKTLSPDAAVPLTLQWLLDLHASQAAKLTLYFYDTLDAVERRQGGSVDAHVEGTNLTNFAIQLRTLQRASEAICVCLLYHVHGAGGVPPPFDREGYALTGLDQKPITGISSFQPIFGCPEAPHPANGRDGLGIVLQKGLPIVHAPNVISLISDGASSLTLNQAAPFRFQDRLARCTYYLARTDVRCYLVVILGDQPASGKDAAVIDAITAVRNGLRATAVFDRLLKV